MIGVIIANDIFYTPYVWSYVNKLEELNYQYEVIMWDRHYKEGKKYPIEIKHILKLNSNETKNKILKIKDYLIFRKFLIKVLKENNYTKLIFLSTFTAIFLPKIIFEKFKGNYIFDFRDATYEYLPFFLNKEKFIIKNAYCTTISSYGFKEILPQTDFLLTHNMNFQNINFYRNPKHLNDKIVLHFYGALRDFDYLKRNIDIFGKNEKFIIKIYGDGPIENLITKYVEEKGYHNIEFLGRYDSNTKKETISQCDALLYNYQSNFTNNYATANKLYDGLIYGKPLIGNIDTFSGRFIEENQIGISLSYNDKSFTDKIINYLKKIDFNNLFVNQNRLLEKIQIDNNKFEYEIERFFSKKI